MKIRGTKRSAILGAILGLCILLVQIVTLPKTLLNEVARMEKEDQTVTMEDAYLYATNSIREALRPQYSLIRSAISKKIREELAERYKDGDVSKIQIVFDNESIDEMIDPTMITRIIATQSTVNEYFSKKKEDGKEYTSWDDYGTVGTIVRSSLSLYLSSFFYIKEEDIVYDIDYEEEVVKEEEGEETVIKRYTGIVNVPILFTTEYYLKDEKDKVLQEMVEEENISLTKAKAKLGQMIDETQMSINSVLYGYASAIHGGVLFSSYGENTLLRYEEALPVWEQAKMMQPDGSYLNPFWDVADAREPWRIGSQCTTFAWWRFYDTYSYDSGARGNGKGNAKEIVDAHPDLFYLSNSPAPGAVFSQQNHNHVGFIEKVDDTYIWESDGNVFFHGDQEGGGIRINYKWTYEEFFRFFGSDVVFAVPFDPVEKP